MRGFSHSKVTNNHGQVCDGRVESLHCFSPLEAEAKALWLGSRLAVELSSPCIVLTDCLSLVKALRGQFQSWPWRAAAWLGRIKVLTASHPMIMIDHIKRKRNSKANCVAKSCARKQLPNDWIHILDVGAPLL
ncbi:unnamed protein product [Linum trigynum]|uniref:RNase H type-1 domain-containing protein n=1 Tax=Linum trigynum TaxID=586398 RepID=A0AAV2EY19_9ROSI